jgi:predicted signal transduction protein with EAL and GGDEF domain
MPFYNWTLMLPSFAAAFGVLWMAAAMEQNPETRSQWFVAMTMLVVYVFNTFETLHKQTYTQRALDGARKEANNRLKELERLTRHDSLTGLLNRRGFDLSLADPPPLKWSAAMFRKRRIHDGKQATQARGNSHEVTTG